MKINNNSPIWQWYEKFYLKGANVPLPKLRSNRNVDTFKISRQVEETVRRDPQRPYSGDISTDKAALKNKLWRTDPLYRVPPRLFSSPEVTADREAALEKLRRNEEITEWEFDLLRTFPDMGEGVRLENEARNEGTRVKYQNIISTALSNVGIELSENDELQFEVWGYDITVTGTISDDKLELAKEALSEYAHALQYIYQVSGHSDEAKAGGFRLHISNLPKNFSKTRAAARYLI